MSRILLLVPLLTLAAASEEDHGGACVDSLEMKSHPLALTFDSIESAVPRRFCVRAPASNVHPLVDVRGACTRPANARQWRMWFADVRVSWHSEEGDCVEMTRRPPAASGGWLSLLPFGGGYGVDVCSDAALPCHTRISPFEVTEVRRCARATPATPPQLIVRNCNSVISARKVRLTLRADWSVTRHRLLRFAFGLFIAVFAHRIVVRRTAGAAVPARAQRTSAGYVVAVFSTIGLTGVLACVVILLFMMMRTGSRAFGLGSVFLGAGTLLLRKFWTTGMWVAVVSSGVVASVTFLVWRPPGRRTRDTRELLAVFLAISGAAVTLSAVWAWEVAAVALVLAALARWRVHAAAAKSAVAAMAAVGSASRTPRRSMWRRLSVGRWDSDEAARLRDATDLYQQLLARRPGDLDEEEAAALQDLASLMHLADLRATYTRRPESIERLSRAAQRRVRRFVSTGDALGGSLLEDSSDDEEEDASSSESDEAPRGHRTPASASAAPRRVARLRGSGSATRVARSTGGRGRRRASRSPTRSPYTRQGAAKPPRKR